jgi:hypothetical protein
MSALVRGALVVIGVLLMLAGLGVIAGLPGAGVIPGLELVGFGGFLVIVVAVERHRYRSEAAEPTNAPGGPGGGEPKGTKLEPRFRATAEAFIDPTTGVRMRVAVDSATGERRYLADE